MESYSDEGLAALPIPDFRIGPDGIGEREWILRFAQALDTARKSSLMDLLTDCSTTEVAFSLSSTHNKKAYLLACSREHPGADLVMFATRRLLGRIDGTGNELLEIEGVDAGEWRKHRFIR